MGLFKSLFGGKSDKEKMDELAGMLDVAEKKLFKELTEMLSDPNIEVRKDCSEYIAESIIPAIKSQKQCYDRDNAIEKMALLAKEMRAPKNELEEHAMKSGVFYFSMYMLKNGPPK